MLCWHIVNYVYDTISTWLYPAYLPSLLYCYNNVFVLLYEAYETLENDMQKGDALVKLLLVWGVDCIASVAFKNNIAWFL